jgi:hypothetical protein
MAKKYSCMKCGKKRFKKMCEGKTIIRKDGTFIVKQCMACKQAQTVPVITKEADNGSDGNNFSTDSR